MDRTNHATIAGTEQPGHVTVDGADRDVLASTDGRDTGGTDRSNRRPMETTGLTRRSIKVEEVGDGYRKPWNDVVEQTPHGTPFHQFEFLETIERHADADLRPLVGRVDDDPVGVFPLFEWQSAAPLQVAFSPPPKMGLYLLGPVVIEPGDSPAVERRYGEFVRGCLDWMRSELGASYVHVETTCRFGDVRPFAWRDYDVTPRFTYLVDLNREQEDLFMSFSGDARRNVRKCRDDDTDCAVEVGDTESIGRIVASVNDRYAEQGESFSLDPAFVTDLYTALPDGQVRPYVTTVDGEFAGGMIALEHGDTIYRWQGGTVPDVELPVNDFLDWHIMQDALNRDLRWYDLVGANTERICEYKAKFDPELVCYYTLTGGNRLVRTGVDLLDGRVTRLRQTLLGI